MRFIISLGLISSLAFVIGCQSIRTREDVRRQPPHPSAPQAPSQQTEQEAVEPEGDVSLAPPPPPVIPSMPKIGIILGAGGAKAYAHIGFLHELVRAKVPIHSIGGVEFAAPMAALFANKEQANDVEWQMFKLKSDDVIKTSLLGSVSKNTDVTVLKEFIASAFSRGTKAENFRVPFACPSYNFAKNQVYLMNRGSIDQLMYLCMAYPPFFKPYQGNIAGARDITALAQYLRSKGADYIVLVNVLQPPGSSKPYTLDAAATDNVLWSEIAGLYNKPFQGVDSVVSLDTSNYGIMDFDKRREIMSKGADSAARQLKDLTRKWGL